MEGKERSDGGIDPHRGFPFPSIERDASTLSSHLVDDPLIIAAVITVGGGFLFFAATFASWGVKVKRVGWGCSFGGCVALLCSAFKECKGNCRKSVGSGVEDRQSGVSVTFYRRNQIGFCLLDFHLRMGLGEDFPRGRACRVAAFFV